ncbi:MAG: M56 family metallopeptidase [Fuerstiella sp.]|nr:M56 family metallopeptidase [Fuerstiella sp.]
MTCVRRIRTNRIHDFDVELSVYVGQLCRQLRIRQVPDIVVSDVLFGPAVLGFFHHTIVLPKCLLQTENAQRAFSLESLNPILVHELLHIRRGDLVTGTLQTVVQCLWWFHPAVWFANRMLSRDAERCCDEQVLAELGCGPAEYARSLLSVIESKQPLQAVPVFPGMKPVEITSQRMERIMSLKHGSQKRMPWWHWAVVLGFGLLVLPGAECQVSESKTTSSSTIPQPNSSQLESLIDVLTVSVSDDEKIGAQTAAVSVPDGSGTRLTANTVVANVNGRLIVLDDMIGSVRQAIDAKEGLSDNQRQQFLKSQIRNRLHSYIQQELVVQELKQEIPEHRQHEIMNSLEQPFRELIANIRNDRDVTTNKELDEVLLAEGLSVHFLRQNFFRVQMVHGYLSSLAGSRDTFSRAELLTYYEEHRSDFTTHDRIAPFKAVRKEIERRLRAEHVRESHQKVMQKLRVKASVVTMFGDATEASTAAAEPQAGTVGFGKLTFGTGVNSDAGVTGSTVISQDEFEKQLGSGTDQLSRPGPELLTVVYNVADLVVPVQKSVSSPGQHESAVLKASRESAADAGNDSALPVPAPVRPISHADRTVLSSNPSELDFAPLVELIRASVATDTWSRESGPAQIVSYPGNLSIVNRQTAEAHDEITDLLSALRKEHQLIVVADAKLVHLPENKDSDWLNQAIELNPSSDGLRWALSTESRTEKMTDYVTDGGGRVISSPRIKTLPGHMAEISVSGTDEEGQPSGLSLSLTARPFGEGQLLRLNYQIGVNESLTAGGRGTGLLKSGQTLVVEYVPGDDVQVGVPVASNVPYVNKLFRNVPSQQDRYLIAITPRLVRTDVEEAPLDRASVDHEVGNSSRVMPPVAVDR